MADALFRAIAEEVPHYHFDLEGTIADLIARMREAGYEVDEDFIWDRPVYRQPKGGGTGNLQEEVDKNTLWVMFVMVLAIINHVLILLFTQSGAGSWDMVISHRLGEVITDMAVGVWWLMIRNRRGRYTTWLESEDAWRKRVREVERQLEDRTLYQQVAGILGWNRPEIPPAPQRDPIPGLREQLRRAMGELVGFIAGSAQGSNSFDFRISSLQRQSVTSILWKLFVLGRTLRPEFAHALSTISTTLLADRLLGSRYYKETIRQKAPLAATLVALGGVSSLAAGPMLLRWGKNSSTDWNRFALAVYLGLLADVLRQIREKRPQTFEDIRDEIASATIRGILPTSAYFNRLLIEGNERVDNERTVDMAWLRLYVELATWTGPPVARIAARTAQSIPSVARSIAASVRCFPSRRAEVNNEEPEVRLAVGVSGYM